MLTPGARTTVLDLLPVLGGAFPAAALIGGRVRARAAFEPGDLGKLLIEADRFRAGHPVLDRVDQGRLARRVDLADPPAVVRFLVVEATDKAALAGFAPGTTNKWEALTSLGIDRYDAFGNGINDLDLLRHARHAVRVGGHPALDGIAQVTVAPDPQAVAAEITRPAARP
ncbi:hypothetical protein [Streptomyces sp. AM6-12]|uniref:hypothetical protein n=1 Tax=Streptomyces sp. AM6-12 TaxID=3345149 RepID=UPI0037BA4912